MKYNKNGRKKINAFDRQSLRKRKIFLIFLFPAVAFLLYAAYINEEPEEPDYQAAGIPEEYVPIYKAAGEKYGVPWPLLAAHHRVETIFSTMDPMASPVGAEGHMQFMPCTFVGWSHPTCGGLGQGKISQDDKTNPEIIKKYGGYGIDANGDGKADPFDIEDAIFSAANYLAKNGAANGDIRRAVFAYNRSERYVEDVLYYYEQYKQY